MRDEKPEGRNQKAAESATYSLPTAFCFLSLLHPSAFILAFPPAANSFQLAERDGGLMSVLLICL